MEQEVNFNFELSDEQRKALEGLVQVIEKIWDALLEMVRAFMEAVHKAFDFICRSWTHLQLLEWRLPPLTAKFVSEKIPSWLAFRIGGRWFYGKVHALE